MDERIEACLVVVERCVRGELSPQVALMEMLIASEDSTLVQAALAEAKARSHAPQLDVLTRVYADNRAGCERIAAILRAEQTPDAVRSVADSVAFSRRLFDQLVSESEETSVALYSLGSPDILAAATREIVEQLQRRGLLLPETRVLDVGAGIGRLALALAPHVARVEGIDISPGMVAAATRRCAGLPNVHFRESTGRDFADFPAGSFELVLAVDSFPYVVQAGATLVEALFDEAARVLVPGGHFVILNFSYRGDLAADAEQAARLAGARGLVAQELGVQPFSLWNGALFSLRRT